MTDNTTMGRIYALTDAASAWREAQAQTEAARHNLIAAAIDATQNGVSQSEAARLAGVDRLTLRKWIGA